MKNLLSYYSISISHTHEFDEGRFRRPSLSDNVPSCALIKNYDEATLARKIAGFERGAPKSGLTGLCVVAATTG